MPSAPGVQSRGQIAQMQSQMEQMQATLSATMVTGSAGGGAVTVEMTGDQQLRAITIKPEVVDPEDVEMLQDLIMAAFKEASEKVAELMNAALGPLAGGLGLGGLS
ncbi:MAG: YbaB/EbfC family nucleoid-associated protein [Chloroflexi bacterium]|nr:YbaB/EbfC family nucleoid-associated protein [Chloroflexota bacterium]